MIAGAYHQSLSKQKASNRLNEDNSEPVSWKNVLIVAWSGTRGVVSMATALALPFTLKKWKPVSTAGSYHFSCLYSYFGYAGCTGTKFTITYPFAKN